MCMHRVTKVSPEPRETGLGDSGYTYLFRRRAHQRQGQEKLKAGYIEGLLTRCRGDFLTDYGLGGIAMQ